MNGNHDPLIDSFYHPHLPAEQMTLVSESIWINRLLQMTLVSLLRCETARITGSMED